LAYALDGGPLAAIISESFWTRRFARDPAAIGRTLVVGGRSYEIVGVMPRTFTSATTDVWLPAQLGKFLLGLRDARFMGGIGRLKPGVTIEEGARDLVSVQDALGREFPRTDAGWSAEIRSLKDARIGTSRRGLVLVFAAVASLWLIAVANIAGLTLVQVRRRGRELAIRSALGASRLRVLATVFREGVVVAAAGGALGIALAWWIVTAIPAILSTTPRINELGLDWRAMAFAAATSIMAGCGFSLVPALAATRPELARVTGSGSRTIAGNRHRFQGLLVVTQVALSIVLVGSATLLLRSYFNLTRVDTGFDVSNAVTFHVGARWDEDRTKVGLLQEQLVDRLSQLRHVQSVGLANFLPTTGATLRYQVLVDGLTGPNQDGSITIGSRMMSGGYLPALKARLIAGNWCPPLRMDFKAPRYAMINQQFVEQHAAGQNLIGRTARLTQQPTLRFTVAGVIANMAEDGYGTTPVPYLYTCDSAGSWPDPEYVASTSDPKAFVSDLRQIVRELDPGRAIFGVRPLNEIIDRSLEQPRLDAAMLTVFATAAVTLAAIGLYSLFMLVVSERAREMAVRLALGAEPRQLVQLVMAGAGRLLAVGIGIGILLTATADRLLRGVVFGVSPLDARALATATLTLAVVAGIAVAVPAIRAARIAPNDALKGE
jgi:predicted permease